MSFSTFKSSLCIKLLMLSANQQTAELEQASNNKLISETNEINTPHQKPKHKLHLNSSANK